MAPGAWQAGRQAAFLWRKSWALGAGGEFVGSEPSRGSVGGRAEDGGGSAAFAALALSLCSRGP